MSKIPTLRTALLYKAPFFANILYSVLKVKGLDEREAQERGIPVAATDGGTIYLRERVFDMLSLREGVFILCHEVAHCMWRHMLRAEKFKTTGLFGRPFNPELWNAAGDYIINDMLIKSGIGMMPEGDFRGLHDKRFTYEMTITEVYEQLLEEGGGSGQGESEGEGEGEGEGKGGNSGNDDGTGGKGKGFDVHLSPESDQPALSESQMKQVIVNAANVAKSAGKLPAGMERYVEELLQPDLDWRDLLPTAISKVAGRARKTWSRMHRRRFVRTGIVYAAKTGVACGELVVVCDTSGSIGNKELTRFLSELDGILNTMKPAKVYFLPVDARVGEVTVFGKGETLALKTPKLTGGGGTSFAPPFRWVEENNVKPDALIYFTDMMGDFPQPPSYPTIWCSSVKDTKGPFGQTIFVDI